MAMAEPAQHDEDDVADDDDDDDWSESELDAELDAETEAELHEQYAAQDEADTRLNRSRSSDDESSDWDENADSPLHSKQNGSMYSRADAIIGECGDYVYDSFHDTATPYKDHWSSNPFPLTWKDSGILVVLVFGVIISLYRMGQILRLWTPTEVTSNGTSKTAATLKFPEVFILFLICTAASICQVHVFLTWISTLYRQRMKAIFPYLKKRWSPKQKQKTS